MKVLDAAELHAGVEETLKGLSQLNVQLETIEKNIKALIALEDSFKGDGGHSIRSFYEEAHLPLLRFWQDTLAQYETALKQLISSLRGFEPSPQGFIRQSFLEHDVEQGLKQAETITRDLTAEGNRIMDSVSDIVALPRLNDSAFVQQVKTAEQHEQETLERLHEFDRQGSYSLEATSQDLHTLHRTIQEISTLFERRELVLSQYRPSQLALKLSILPIPNLERFLSYSLSSVQTNLEEQGLTTNPAATANDSVHETEANWRGWLSGGLDFIPGISNIKSGIEAMTGKDFITGRDIGHLERGVLLAAIFGGPIAKGGVKVFKWGGKQLDKIKHVLNPDRVIETGKAVLAKVKQGFNSLRNTAAGLMKKIADTPLPTPQFAMAGGAKMPQATIGDAVNSAKNSVMNFAQKVKDGVGKGIDKTRPSWRQSEIDVGKEYPGYRDQVSYKEGNEVSHGTKNSSRPDFYIDGHSIEVKNYNVTTSSGRSNLIRNVSKQINKRVSDLPEQTKQSVIIDVRGQNISRDVLRDIKQKINERTNDVAEIIFIMD
ncbi:T7SS effector LXG polymorphic toxin [Robertmurraya sp. DFI.2.37]|uniref:T7SS effector LXG polymorphic toxin n=1 Tax=Robertmurraya sp. DFI.2.37 TaxID=3031819 RepID=UPI0012477C03|nr:T7SS effector LXG polymorphic toxin [Robertmurraya sp. DFI.2.37]MDF1507808.1 T7SS effector LXG polymorphic toxin [Robertmurraya sp. DFI.2.37]